ncbi:endoribonuclease CG2145-like isoform X2 [Sitodiplosis mosellana]|nr:endoribonuclease CG2145-like isoform X2 [Sitodiplosis mosellana]XP_055300526.1 endoribonuclease CG2145-like isoform X2 [Sitodiplosis mosellana]
MAKLILLAIAMLALCIITCDSKLPASDVEITNLSELLFKNADNRLSKKVFFNIKANPVLRVNDTDLSSVETIRTMRPLFKNFKIDSALPEVVTQQIEAQQDKFLDAVIKTTAMTILKNFFKKKNVDGIYNVDEAVAQRNFKHLLKVLWFTNYARMRGGAKGSSGFEHVFCKEIIYKNNVISHGELSGFHNWIHFYDQEMAKTRKLTFQQLTRDLTLSNNFRIVKYKVSYDNMEKITSMFIGTTPDFEMSLYTLCVVMDRETCQVSLGKKRFFIKTFVFSRGQDKLVASSYPAI